MGQPDKVKIGAGFMWFRPTITSDLRVTLGSRYTGATEPDLIFSETDFCWSMSGLFLGQSQNIDLSFEYEDTEEDVDFVNAPTDNFVENQSTTITASLAYNGVDNIASLFELPEVWNGVTYLGGRNITPLRGSLLILESNVRVSDPRYRDIVRARLYFNCSVKPTKKTLNNGHTYIEAKFRVLASIDDATGCYREYTYNRWLTSIKYPNTYYNPDGTSINTDIDIAYPLSMGIRMNL